MKTAEELAAEYAKKEVGKDRGQLFDMNEVRRLCERDFLAGYNAREQWISVEDRLPEWAQDASMSSEVLAVGKSGGMMVCSLFRTHDLKFTGYQRSGSALFDVTHWMPLPNAPKP